MRVGWQWHEQHVAGFELVPDFVVFVLGAVPAPVEPKIADLESVPV